MERCLYGPWRNKLSGRAWGASWIMTNSASASVHAKTRCTNHVQAVAIGWEENWYRRTCEAPTTLCAKCVKCEKNKEDMGLACRLWDVERSVGLLGSG